MMVLLKMQLLIRLLMLLLVQLLFRCQPPNFMAQQTLDVGFVLAPQTIHTIPYCSS
jgi:hypothetical protein